MSEAPAPDLLLRGARPWGSAGSQIAVRDGHIVAVGDALEPGPATEIVDLGGAFVLPGFVDGHAHLDKTLWGRPWHVHSAGPSVRERIDDERRVRAELGLSAQVQSERLLQHMLARGTTHVRTHVDVTPDVALSRLHGVLATKEAWSDRVDMQIVAFPQTGVAGQPGVLELLDAAVAEGAMAIGGVDPIGIDGHPTAQLDAIFAIADRRGCEIDIHLHDRGEDGAATLERIAERTHALGLRGRVAVGHAFCLGMVGPARLDALTELLLRNDIAVMTHAPSGGTPFPPIRHLARAGVRLFTGSDGVRDTWSPLNSGDMLERAYLLAYLSGFRDDEGLELALRMATYGGAQLMRRGDYGLAPDCAADLVVVDATCAAEAVALHPPRLRVFRRGREAARDGRLTGAAVQDADPH